jgi:hypothetical protein
MAGPSTPRLAPVYSLHAVPAAVMCVSHEQPVRIGRPELAAEWAEALSCERRAWCCYQQAVPPHSEAVYLRCTDARAPINLVSVALNSTSPGWAEPGNETVDLAIGVRLPQRVSRKPGRAQSTDRADKTGPQRRQARALERGDRVAPGPVNPGQPLRQAR